MDNTETLYLPAGLAPAEFWPALAQAVHPWLNARGLPLRDVQVLLPFVELLPPARLAFAAQGGWQPRIDTLHTLLRALPPAVSPAPPALLQDAAPGSGGFLGEPALDRLAIARLLRDEAGLADWQRRDPRAFDQAVDAVRRAAQVLVQGAAAQAPHDREAWWQTARHALPPATDGSAMASLLAEVALAWAALAPAPATDQLLALRPAAWVVLVAGDQDPLTRMLAQQAACQGVPVLHLLADGSAANPFDTPQAQAPRVWTCADAEDEALAAATAVLDALHRGQAPVALVAEDRLQVRRIRALLERAGASLADESGWTLDTTRAGARLMAWLRAAHPGAGRDAWLDWLKAEQGGAGWVDALERHWRQGHRPGATTPGSGANSDTAQAVGLVADKGTASDTGTGTGPAVDTAATTGADACRPLGPSALMARWAAWQQMLQPLVLPRQRPLKHWLTALREALLAAPQSSWWQLDEAGRAVWQALRLHSAATRADLDALVLSLDEFTQWVDSSLSEASFRPGLPEPQVVVTPMARAMLRPFGAIVLPGADDSHLGPPRPGPSLWPDSFLRQLGLPDSAAQGQRSARCFVQLLRHPDCLLLRRHADGDEPLAPSPWLARLNLARQRRGDPPIVETPAPAQWRELDAQPVAPPAPVAIGALPSGVSASAVEALRACPYRFFARSVLRLAEDEELEADPGKREYGTVLHATLQRFHDQRQAQGLDAAPDGAVGDAALAHFLACAHEAAAESGLDAAAMLPFTAGLPAFGQRYLQWLAQRQAQGWRYLVGELPCKPVLDGLGGQDGLGGLAGLELRGRIDRIDRISADGQQGGQGGQGGQVWQVLDYKTGSALSLKDKVKDPLEDTQLAFYAAQLLSGGAAPAHALPADAALSAAYVALDERDGIVELAHEDVAASARALLAGLADEWPRMAAGAPLLALGEGLVCNTCEARGLCRRDHWWPKEATS